MYTIRAKKYNRLELEALNNMLSSFITICNSSCNRGAGCKICEYRTFCNDCYHIMQYVDETLNGKNS